MDGRLNNNCVSDEHIMRRRSFNERNKISNEFFSLSLSLSFPLKSYKKIMRFHYLK